MDMPISQVNIRLFANLPPDPGLGLLFAVGTVSQIVYASGDRPIQFTLRHAGYALRCKVSPSVDLSFELTEGEQVRATGHLSFSSQSAQFHLLVRDMELLEGEGNGPQRLPMPTDRKVVPDWLTGVQRRAESAPPPLLPADIPDWVQALAPEEERDSIAQWGEQRMAAVLQAPAEVEVEAEVEAQDEELFSYLLEALERSEHEDIELTAEELSQFSASPTVEPTEPVAPPPPKVKDQKEQPLPPAAAPARSYRWLFLLAALMLILGAILILLYISSQF